MSVLAGQLSLFELGADPDDAVSVSPRQPSRAKPPPRFEPPPSASTETVDTVTLLTGVLAKLGAEVGHRPASARVDLRQARDDWLRRLETARRSASALTAYRIAIDDLLDWSAQDGRSVFGATACPTRSSSSRARRSRNRKPTG